MITFLRNLVFHDFWLKLFSLALAFLIWFTVSFAIQRSLSPATSLTGANLKELTYFNLPLRVYSTAADLDLRGYQVNPSEVTVTVRGEAKQLQTLQPNDIRVFVDLAGIGTGGLRKRIEVSTPPGVTFVQVVPEEADILARLRR
jgi:YbbR domain-containing protein